VITLRISLDRELPVPISAQLKGQIEYGIVSGALKPGELLPSVRDLASAEGIAHVTVSHVYRALKREGLIAMRPGKGTYVADAGDGQRSVKSLSELQRLVDAMVLQALERGFTAKQISHMLTARLAGRQARRLRIAMVGMFGHATAVYVRELRILLSDIDPEVTPYTIERLRTSGDEIERVCSTDLILTIANRVKEVQSLLPPEHGPVRGLTFLAHPETVRHLSGLPADLRLGVVCTFAEFLPTMLHGISTYGTLSSPPLCAVLSDVERVNDVLERADAVVYATGSETVVAHIPRSIEAFEYLHAPEPSCVAALRPLIDRLMVSRNGERRGVRQKVDGSMVG
jgi:DNA-binding transcriptional regulator YhcF (GntR family)